MLRELMFQGRRFCVWYTGGYSELVEIKLERLEPSEVDQNRYRVQRYVDKFQLGSPFPPIWVCGITPRDPLYKISDGHHRYQAAKICGCWKMAAWTNFYVDRSSNDVPSYSSARVSETALGRVLADQLDIDWCPRCAGVLNYHGGDMCVSCQLTLGMDYYDPDYYRVAKERLGW